jgi:hypothetical protein
MIALQCIKLELPAFFICAISLQSIKLELSPFYILRDCIAIYYIRVTCLFYFVRFHCNLLNWSYLPFIFCVIALQSITLELPPFYILCDFIAIYLIGVISLFKFCMIALQSIKLELPPFYILHDCIAIY